MQHVLARAHRDPVALDLDDLGIPAVILERTDRETFSVAHVNSALRAAVAETNAGTSDVTPGLLPLPLLKRLAAQALVACSTGGAVTRDLRLINIGTDIWWRVTLRPLGGNRLIGTAVNVADLKALSFRQSEEIARQSETISLTRSMAGLTVHDTRTPLANLVSLSDMMLEELEARDDDCCELARSCASVARSALQSVETLMGRLTATDPFVPRDEVVAFGDLCRDVASLVDPSQRLEIIFPEALVEADAALLQVGLRNLMDNAARYADRVIEIFLDTAPDQVCFVVADDGPGFGKGRNPFCDPGENLRAGGHGYGLGAVYRLISGIGGKITPLPPRIGRGATVRISMPGRVLCVGATRSNA